MFLILEAKRHFLPKEAVTPKNCRVCQWTTRKKSHCQRPRCNDVALDNISWKASSLSCCTSRRLVPIDLLIPTDAGGYGDYQPRSRPAISIDSQMPRVGNCQPANPCNRKLLSLSPRRASLYPQNLLQGSVALIKGRASQ